MRINCIRTVKSKFINLSPSSSEIAAERERRRDPNMCESEESNVFCDGYEGTFTYHQFHGNRSFEQTTYDEESKSIRLSPDSTHQQEEDGEWASPLGLRLRKTPSFLSLLQSSLSKGKQPNDPSTTNMESEKLKASNFPAIFIKIGSWERFTRHQGDLTVKLYYAKRKLVWEVLDGALKSKIEIEWSNISAIRALTAPNEPGILEIELNQPPSFYREINPQPRKHTLWQQASDFTGGQAPIWRRHCVTIQPGILDKHYEKLLQCDKRLLDLSQKPFPSHDTSFGHSEFSLNFSRYGVHYPYQTYPTIPRVPPPIMLPPNPPTLAMGWGSSYALTSEQATQYHGHEDYYQVPNVGLLANMDNHLVGDQIQFRKVEQMPVATESNADHRYGGIMGDHGAGNMNAGVYSDWQYPNDQYDHSMVMQAATTNPLPAFLFPGAGDFF